jgi:hypothetical protein
MSVRPAIDLVILALCLLAIGERSAEAYVEPGSASYLFQLLAGGVLGAIFLIRPSRYRRTCTPLT